MFSAKFPYLNKNGDFTKYPSKEESQDRRKGFVYIAQFPQVVFSGTHYYSAEDIVLLHKIGCSRNLKTRMNALSYKSGFSFGVSLSAFSRSTDMLNDEWEIQREFYHHKHSFLEDNVARWSYEFFEFGWSDIMLVLQHMHEICGNVTLIGTDKNYALV